MKLNLPTLTQDQIAIAKTPELGAETSNVKVTTGSCFNLGTIEVTGATPSDFVFAPITVDLTDVGADLHLRVQNAVVGGTGGTMTVVANVIYDDATTGTATASLDIPAWSSNQNNEFAEGHATDFIPDAGGDVDKLIRSVVSIVSVNNTMAGNRFTIFSSPPLSSFSSIGCAKSKDGAFNSPTSVHIQCGYDKSAFIKKGVSEQANLTLTYAYVSVMESLLRLNGHYVTVLIQTLKDDSVPWENRLYTRHLVSVKDSRGEGDDEVTATSEGAYENILVGWAR